MKKKKKKHIALWSASNSTMRSVENSRFIHIYPSFFKKSYWCQISIITNGYSCCCCVNFVVIFRPSAISIWSSMSNANKTSPLTQKPNFIVHFNSKKLKKLRIYVAKWNSAKTGVVTRFYNHNQLILRPNIRWSLIASCCLHHLFFTRECETYSLEVFLQWAMGGVY